MSIFDPKSAGPDPDISFKAPPRRPARKPAPAPEPVEPPSDAELDLTGPTARLNPPAPRTALELREEITPSRLPGMAQPPAGATSRSLSTNLTQELWDKLEERVSESGRNRTDWLEQFLTMVVAHVEANPEIVPAEELLRNRRGPRRFPKNVNVQLDPTVREPLRRMSNRYGTSMSRFVRWAIYALADKLIVPPENRPF